MPTSPILPVALRCLAVLGLLSLANCGALDRAANIGRTPNLHTIDIAGNPQPKGDEVVVPMPPASLQRSTPNSLWQTGARGFFKDQRAGKIGDLLTVMINISDQANIADTTSRSRTGKEDTGIPNLFGLENKLPKAIDPTSLLSASSDNSHVGKGTVNRSEKVILTVAAVVTQVLPNGNLVIRGRQEVRVNFEVRELFVSGIVRPEDISATNTIQHTQIAEARIAYGGRGQLTDVQQPSYGQQLMDIFTPF